MIMTHPTPWEFHPVHHPSYIDFFEQVLADTTDPLEIEARTRSSSPRTSGTATSTARATPTTASTRSTCGTGARHGLQHLGKVIIVGGDAAAGAPARLHAGVDAATTRSRWPPTSSAATPTITHLHNPPLLMADVT